MKFYVATRLENVAAAKALASELESEGHELTYDWTRHGSVQSESREVKRAVAAREREGIRQARVVVVLLPGGRGTHCELGMAVAYGKQVLLVSDSAEVQSVRTCVFYWHDFVMHLPDPGAVVTWFRAATTLESSRDS